MKRTIVILSLMCFMAIPSVVFAGDCNPDTSPTSVSVVLGGQTVKFCSLKEAYTAAFVNRPGAKSDDLNNRAVEMMMKDFRSGDYFNFYDGFYIIDSTIKVKNANAPYILGFSDRIRAWEYWENNAKKIGGRVVNFETATREYAKAAAGPSKKNLSKQAAAAKQVEFLLKKKGE